MNSNSSKPTNVGSNDQGALERMERLRAALTELVRLKDIKDGWEMKYLRGQKPTAEDLAYETEKPKAWDAARAALAWPNAKLTGPSENQGSTDEHH